MSKRSSLHSAISLGPPKEAAIYFERVFPFDMTDNHLRQFRNPRAEADPNAIPFQGNGFDSVVVNSLMGSEGAQLYINYGAICFIFAMITSHAKGILPNYSEFISSSEFKELINRIPFDLREDVKSFAMSALREDFSFEKFVLDITPLFTRYTDIVGFKDTPTWRADGASPAELDSEAGASKRYMMSVQGLDIIDIDRMSWEAVVELRKDKAAMRELRDFRLFFTENFDHKDPSYVRDKLLSLHDRQKVTARAWGLDTIQRSLGVIVSAETAASTSLVSAALAIIGGPAVAIGGAVIPLDRKSVV